VTELDQREGYRRIERRAFERYLLELVQGFAAEAERLNREIRGEELNVQVRNVELVGEYPDTALHFQLFDRVRGVERESERRIWDPDFVNANGRPKSGAYVAGEILTLVRGG
jgi:hypothetical protein